MIRIPKYKLSLVRESNCSYEYDRKVSSPEVMAEMLNSLFSLDEQAEEVFVILCFDAKLKVSGAFEVSRGEVSQALVHPREIFKRAFLLNAAAIAIAHNHPSGDPEPSKEDKTLTARLKGCCDLMGIRLLDHIIIGHCKHYSFLADEIL